MKAGLPSSATNRQFSARSLVAESLLVAIVGAVFAFAANAISPRGLSLARDYFPGSSGKLPVSAAGHARPTSSSEKPASETRMDPNLEALASRLSAQGLQLAQSNGVIALFRDPRYEQELVVFIDARNEEDFEKGHVPGAYLFDHYHAEKYLPSLLPVCQTADRVVVYCGGGDCEDSEFSAITLKDAGVPATNLCVYGGGFSEWATNGLPIEIGARKSGQFLKSR